jgi:hypothetical protein
VEYKKLCLAMQKLIESRDALDTQIAELDSAIHLIVPDIDPWLESKGFQWNTLTSRWEREADGKPRTWKPTVVHCCSILNGRSETTPRYRVGIGSGEYSSIAYGLTPETAFKNAVEELQEQARTRELLAKVMAL